MREAGVKVPMVDETNRAPQRHLAIRGARYELGRQVARGAFSTVYEASDERGNRLVAKVCRAEVPASTSRRAASGSRAAPRGARALAADSRLFRPARPRAARASGPPPDSP